MLGRWLDRVFEFIALAPRTLESFHTPPDPPKVTCSPENDMRPGALNKVDYRDLVAPKMTCEHSGVALESKDSLRMALGVPDRNRTMVPMPSPTPEMLASPEFNAVWERIKDWDISVPAAYCGACGATGAHVRAVLDALASVGADKAFDWAALQKLRDKAGY